jgi:micrococcal nuclease
MVQKRENKKEKNKTQKDLPKIPKEKNNKKRSKNRDIILLIGLIVVLLIVDYPFIDDFLKKELITHETGIVEEIIDGDTIKIGNETIRLLGINAPEKGKCYYDDARHFVSELILNQTINLERSKEDTDMYKRKLRYAFFQGENVNLKIVRQGLANYYFPSGNDKYYKDFQEAWGECLHKNINLCEKSRVRCSECILIKEFAGQEVVLENTCDFECNLRGWTIKDEGRKIFTFPQFIFQYQVNIAVCKEQNSL